MDIQNFIMSDFDVDNTSFYADILFYYLYAIIYSNIATYAFTKHCARHKLLAAFRANTEAKRPRHEISEMKAFPAKRLFI